MLQLEEGTRFTVNAPVVRDRKGEYKDVFEDLTREGFTRVKVDGEQYVLEEGVPELDKKFKHTIEVVVDRLVMRADLRLRLTQSIETAAGLADGLVAVDLVDTGEQLLFSENFACPDHGVSLPELQPRIFSFNAPHGACPRCTGLGSQQEIDPDLLVPDPSLSIDDGALVPWSVGGSSGFYEAVIQAIADRYEIDTSKPWAELTDERAEPLPLRHGRREDLRPVPQPHGAAAPVHARLRRHRREPPAALPRDRLLHRARADRGVHVAAPVPGLQGRAPQARGARGHGRRALDPRVHAAVGRAGARRSSTSST